MTRTLLLLLACASATTACTEIPLPPPPRFLLPHEVTLSANVESVTEVDPAGYCEPGAKECRVYFINLAPGSNTARCPFVAIDYWDDEGERYMVWPPTILEARNETWNLIGRRYTRPGCFYALVNATRDPR